MAVLQGMCNEEIAGLIVLVKVPNILPRVELIRKSNSREWLTAIFYEQKKVGTLLGLKLISKLGQVICRSGFVSLTPHLVK